MSATKSTPAEIQVEHLKLGKLLRLASALGVAVRERNELFGCSRGNEEDDMLKRIGEALEALNGEIKEQGLCGAVDGRPVLSGDTRQRVALMKILLFVSGLTDNAGNTRIPLAWPISDLVELETAVLWLERSPRTAPVRHRRRATPRKLTPLTAAQTGLFRFWAKTLTNTVPPRDDRAG
jgi:hypothetical protein